jgi:predicted nucleotidyltransferase
LPGSPALMLAPLATVVAAVEGLAAEHVEAHVEGSAARGKFVGRGFVCLAVVMD